MGGSNIKEIFVWRTFQTLSYGYSYEARLKVSSTLHVFQSLQIFSRIYAPVNSHHFMIPVAIAEICSTFRYLIIRALSSCLDFREKNISFSTFGKNVAVEKNYLCRPCANVPNFEGG